MATRIEIDDKDAQAALEKFAVTPYPGTKAITPESLSILDSLVGNGIEELTLAAQANENMSGEEILRVATRLKGAGEAMIELVQDVLSEHVERAEKKQPTALTNVEGVSFNEQDRMDIDITFSLARDAMRALGWKQETIDVFSDLQYRLRLATGV